MELAAGSGEDDNKANLSPRTLAFRADFCLIFFVQCLPLTGFCVFVNVRSAIKAGKCKACITACVGACLWCYFRA